MSTFEGHWEVRGRRRVATCLFAAQTQTDVSVFALL